MLAVHVIKLFSETGMEEYAVEEIWIEYNWRGVISSDFCCPQKCWKIYLTMKDCMLTLLDWHLKQEELPPFLEQDACKPVVKWVVLGGDSYIVMKGLCNILYN